MLWKRLPDCGEDKGHMRMNPTMNFFIHVLLGARTGLIATGCTIALILLAPTQNAAANADVTAASPSANVVQRYPAGSIESIETADRVLADVIKERSAVETKFMDRERACYAKFFTTSCVNAAKEQRRSALADLRAVEVEADAFKRRAKVADRDKALEAKRTDAETEAVKRIEKGKDKELAREKVSAKPDARADVPVANDRAAQHQAKMMKLQAEEAVNAQKRANNVAAYEKKVRDAEARQREIAAKKEEKERKRAKQPAPASDTAKGPGKS
jgi:colicin import membrane protein